MKAVFRKFAEHIALWVGTPWAFLIALAVLIVWMLAGPILSFSEQWQLAINSVTTIATFRMVFIIQNTQNRDFKALQLKLDALLSASDDAQAALVNLHNFSDEDLHRLEQAFQRRSSHHNIREIIQSLEANGAADHPSHTSRSKP